MPSRDNFPAYLPAQARFAGNEQQAGRAHPRPLARPVPRVATGDQRLPAGSRDRSSANGRKERGEGVAAVAQGGSEESEPLLRIKLAQEAQRTPPHVAAPKRNTVSDIYQAILDRANQLPPPSSVDAKDAPLLIALTAHRRRGPKLCRRLRLRR